MRTIKKKPASIFDFVPLRGHNISFSLFNEGGQMPDMITNGNFAIRREAVRALIDDGKRLNNGVKDAMLCRIRQNTIGRDVSFDNLCNFPKKAKDVAKNVIPLTVAEIIAPLTLSNKDSLICRFDGYTVPIYINAAMCKLLYDMFWDCSWYATGPLKGVLLIRGEVKLENVVAVVMPMQLKEGQGF